MNEETRAEPMNEEAKEGVLIRVKQAASMLCVSRRTVWRMIAAGQLRAVRVRGCTRVLMTEVQRYLKPVKAKGSA